MPCAPPCWQEAGRYTAQRPRVRRGRHARHLLRARERGGEDRRGVTLVLCGKQAIDGDTAQVGPELAEHLGLPFVGFVRRVREVGPGRIVVERMTEEGADVVESPLPAVLSVVKEINTPRLPSLKGKMRAKSFKPVVWNAAALGADEARLGFAGSPTKVVKVFHPEARRGGEMLRGEPAEVAARLAERLRSTNIRPKRSRANGNYRLPSGRTLIAPFTGFPRKI